MKRILCVFILFLISLNVYSANYLYVSYNQSKKISVIDTSASEVFKEIILPCTARRMQLSPDNKYLYFTGYDTNAVYRITTKNLTLDNDFVSVGTAPVAIAVSSDNNRIYVANERSKNISIINAADFNLLEEPIQLPAAPKAIVLSEDDKKAFIGLSEQSGIAVFDTEKLKITGIMPFSTEPWDMCVYGNRLFITNEGVASISVVDVKKNKLLNEIVTTDAPRGLDIIDNLIYVGVSNGVDIFETIRYEKPASVGLDYSTYDVVAGKTSTGKMAFVAGYNKSEKTGKIAVVDVEINEVTSEIDVDGWPMYLEIRKAKPTPTPTETYTPLPTDTPTPKPTFTPQPTNTPKPKPKPTPIPKKTKKPTPVIESSIIKTDLKGRVMLDNQPVKKVKIKAIYKHSDKLYTTYTDDSGRFIFEKIPIGGYVVSVEATYIKEKAVTITLNKGENPDLIINVKRR
ncbi:MAG: carboxypeptidase regulatory-like domain-containing protein [Candidatus Goldbacteria bacterium]|nr:carboxypeptidase regulatory-like domain-containing protein [Candidatus Goldiibacteriota bacterium]